MTALPPASNATNAAATEGDVKTFLTAVRDYLSGLFGTSGVPADARAALGVASLTWANISGKPTSPNITGDWQWSGVDGKPGYVWGSNDGAAFRAWNLSTLAAKDTVYDWVAVYSAAFPQGTSLDVYSNFGAGIYNWVWNGKQGVFIANGGGAVWVLYDNANGWMDILLAHGVQYLRQNGIGTSTLTLHKLRKL